ncbi:NmrA family NAD(P)-binding protein [Caulobacter sp. S45]|uniref:NmrA family NAD(P)-binding protein n=1 Tax=Caulobacter sp. S45 TaxID=1641861 RepID=UPI001575B05E|nr:NmrA family NAD(P)-binding protein [Caulobacter sp. S45]
MILVTAAYGNQGQRLIPLLAQAGKTVRALRASGDLQALKALGATEALQGDASDPAVLARAMEGVETVYHIGPSLHPREEAMGLAVVEAAERAGVKHLVFSSVLHAIEDRLLQHRSKLAIEQRIIVSDLNWTILQPTNYMLPAWSYPVFRTEVFRLWWSLDRRQSLIVLDDYAEVAAKVILEGAVHHGATYELSSGDCLTAYEIADRFAKVTGRPIRAEEVSADAFMVKHRKHHAMQALLDAGRTVTSADFPYEFEVFRAIGACYSESDFVGNPNVLTWLLGRTPTTVEEYLRKEYGRFQAAAR